MTDSSNHLCIILISRDSSLTALLTGYCVGKHIDLLRLHTPEEFGPHPATSDCKLVVLDSRLDPSLASYQPASAPDHDPHYDDLPVFVLYRDRKPYVPTHLTRVHFVEEPDILNALDRYFEYGLAGTPQTERRVKERRKLADRRASARKNGAANGSNGKAKNSDTEKIGDYEINYKTRTVARDGCDLQLTRKEFELFTMLMAEQTEICSIESILQRLWPDTKRANKSDLYQYVHTLRKKLEEDPYAPKCLLTVKGVGYQLRL